MATTKKSINSIIKTGLMKIVMVQDRRISLHKLTIGNPIIKIAKLNKVQIMEQDKNLKDLRDKKDPKEDKDLKGDKDHQEGKDKIGDKDKIEGIDKIDNINPEVIEIKKELNSVHNLII